MNKNRLLRLNYNLKPKEEIRNEKEHYKMKFVAPLISNLFTHKDDIMLCWDINSNIYEKSSAFIVKLKPDITFLSKNNIEIGCCEIKSFNADNDKVELDRIRIGEIAKKQLHKRILKAKSRKSFYTFGMLVYGHQIELYVTTFDLDAAYHYNVIKKLTLPTCPTAYHSMRRTLEYLASFKDLMLKSLADMNDEKIPYLNTYTASSFKPTVTTVRNSAT